MLGVLGWVRWNCFWCFSIVLGFLREDFFWEREGRLLGREVG